MHEEILSTTLHISYCVSLIMVTVTNHIFTNMISSKKGTYFALKFPKGYEKNIQLSFDFKISKRLKKKIRKKLEQAALTGHRPMDKICDRTAVSF